MYSKYILNIYSNIHLSFDSNLDVHVSFRANSVAPLISFLLMLEVEQSLLEAREFVLKIFIERKSFLI